MSGYRGTSTVVASHPGCVLVTQRRHPKLQRNNLDNDRETKHLHGADLTHGTYTHRTIYI